MSSTTGERPGAMPTSTSAPTPPTPTSTAMSVSADTRTSLCPRNEPPPSRHTAIAAESPQGREQDEYLFATFQTRGSCVIEQAGQTAVVPARIHGHLRQFPALSLSAPMHPTNRSSSRCPADRGLRARRHRPDHRHPGHDHELCRSDVRRRSLFHPTGPTPRQRSPTAPHSSRLTPLHWPHHY